VSTPGDRAKTFHELRTPLSVIVGYAELLVARGDEPEMRREASARILEAAERLSDTLDALESGEKV
jgi:signal transduction histidine kinase